MVKTKEQWQSMQEEMFWSAIRAMSQPDVEKLSGYLVKYNMTWSK